MYLRSEQYMFTLKYKGQPLDEGHNNIVEIPEDN